MAKSRRDRRRRPGTGQRKYYPVFLDLKGRLCVVIGGGRVAERKVVKLLECGAKVEVVAPALTPRLAGLAKRERIKAGKRAFRERDLEKAHLVFAASDDHKENARIARLARRRGQLVNAVDSPEDCNFIVPASLRRGPLCISISTDGVSPALARRIRLDLEKTYGKGYAQFLAELAKARRKVLGRVPESAKRRRILRALADSQIVELFSRGCKQEGQEQLHAILQRAGVDTHGERQSASRETG